MRTIATTFATLIALGGLMAPAFAADYEIQLLNKGEAGTMVFEPNFLAIQPGDTVTFVPTDKSHNVENIKDMIPEGVEPFKSKVNEAFTMTFDVPGLYGIKCTPHFAMGMVGAIAVGDDLPNLDAARAVKVPNKAQERLDAAYAGLGL
ncbi:pseudoazurin [Devosia sp. XJ19-1]|uniref:Pseudoazurin n=1 Tax=Devosia ureilytica TaxID=2952754 RepID=A0A9Q4AQJ5_9HYPH|nr:pseudoazurin [Devosia ureilytica]MCP8884466.1 pseudoazurin [Devosia ureilytica]MCP8888074.1 pseudoazurin [Devosia ureilytica]